MAAPEVEATWRADRPYEPDPVLRDLDRMEAEEEARRLRAELHALRLATGRWPPPRGWGRYDGRSAEYRDGPDRPEGAGWFPVREGERVGERGGVVPREP